MATGFQLLPNGMHWEKIPTTAFPEGFKWSCKEKNFEIFRDKQGKYILISFDHDPSTEFPNAEFWMKTFPTLLMAAHQAEGM